jgi:hypothetical protein
MGHWGDPSLGTIIMLAHLSLSPSIGVGWVWEVWLAWSSLVLCPCKSTGRTWAQTAHTYDKITLICMSYAPCVS